jgi:hypothetical protein
MENFHSCFVLKHIFIGSLPNSIHAFTFVLSCILYIELSHNIYIIAKIIQIVQIHDIQIKI